MKPYLTDNANNDATKRSKPNPMETKKFLYLILNKYCNAIIGKQVIKNPMLVFKKYKNGIRSDGKGKLL